MQHEQSGNLPLDLQTENEILKMKLELQYGADFMPADSTDKLPAEIENAWLTHIDAFEKAYAEPYKEISVLEFCGSPSYKMFNELQPGELPQALAGIYELFDANGLNLDSCAPVDAETMYKFITEKFFFHMMDDMRVSGMRICFIYEEFFDESLTFQQSEDLRQKWQCARHMTTREYATNRRQILRQAIIDDLRITNGITREYRRVNRKIIEVLRPVSAP